MTTLFHDLRYAFRMLLKEPGTQVLPQFAGALLPLVEADELIRGFGTEHEVKGGSGVAERAVCAVAGGGE